MVTVPSVVMNSDSVEFWTRGAEAWWLTGTLMIMCQKQHISQRTCCDNHSKPPVPPCLPFLLTSVLPKIDNHFVLLLLTSFVYLWKPYLLRTIAGLGRLTGRSCWEGLQGESKRKWRRCVYLPFSALRRMTNRSCEMTGPHANTSARKVPILDAPWSQWQFQFRSRRGRGLTVKEVCVCVWVYVIMCVCVSVCVCVCVCVCKWGQATWALWTPLTWRLCLCISLNPKP